MCGKGTSQRRSKQGSNAEQGAEKALVLGALVQGHGVHNDDHLASTESDGTINNTRWRKQQKNPYHTRENTAGSKTGNGSSKYQTNRIWSCAANGGANFKQHQRRQEGPLDG
jgi:hypothetical protein